MPNSQFEIPDEINFKILSFILLFTNYPSVEEKIRRVSRSVEFPFPRDFNYFEMNEKEI